MALAVTATARMTLTLYVLALTRHGQSVLAPPDRIRVVGILKCFHYRFESNLRQT
jgi:hypothetical protein